MKNKINNHKSAIVPDYRFSILLALIFAWLIPDELKLFLYQAPEYSQLSEVSGYVTYTQTVGRYGHEMIITDENQQKITMHCNLVLSDSSFCPPNNTKLEKSFFSNRKVKALYSKERALLFELSINDSKLMNYQEQKNAYLSERFHIPLGVILSSIFLTLALFGYLDKRKV